MFVSWHRTLREKLTWLPFLLAFCFIWVSCQPPDWNKPGPSTPSQETPSTQKEAPAVQDVPVFQDGMPGLLEAAHSLVSKLHQSGESKTLVMKDLVPLLRLDVKIQKAHQENVQAFAKWETTFQKQKLDPVMTQRLHEQRDQYLSHYRQYESHIKGVLEARLTQNGKTTPPQKNTQDLASMPVSQIKLERLERFLKEAKPKSYATPLDPNNLPQKVATPDVRSPMTTPQQYADYLNMPPLDPNAPLANPTTDDLKETIETKITPEIQALSDKLKTPLEMYRWVHDNVEFYPIYGSIQGADYCRQTRKCNAFDTASLLIALLRAQKIPARYVLGTIEVPIEKVRNWIGPFSPDSGRAVADALASGGIPTTTVFKGKDITSVKMEHVWVEAWVDYVPSRGRVHVEGDTWVPLDASFKQYTEKPGLDIEKAATVKQQDFEKAFQTVHSSAALNSVGGMTKFPKTEPVDKLASQFRSQVFSASQNVKKGQELYGYRSIQTLSQTFLTRQLPQQVVSLGQRIPTLPEQLQCLVTIRVKTKVNPLSILSSSSADVSYQTSLVEVLQEKLVLGYKPEGQPDAKAVFQAISAKQQFIPTAVRVFPVLTLGKKEVAKGKAIRIGSPNQLQVVVKMPHRSDTATHSIVAGDLSAIVFNPGVIASGQFEEFNKLKKEMKAWETLQASAKEKIQKAEALAVSENLLYGAGLTFWAQRNLLEAKAARQYNVLATRYPSVGLFSRALDVTYAGFGFFQAPRSVRVGHFRTDIQHDSAAVLPLQNNSNAGKKDFFISTGIAGSFWEAFVWSYLFVGEVKEPSAGVSTIHVMRAAASQGIPVYQIRRDNLKQAIGKLSLPSSLLTSIENAVRAGKSVVVPARTVTVGQWKGSGYVVYDEASGAGSYFISNNLGGAIFQDAPPWAQPLVDTLKSMFFTYWGLVEAAGDLSPIASAAFQSINNAVSIFGILGTVLSVIAIYQSDLTDSEKNWFAGITVFLAGAGVVAGAVAAPLIITSIIIAASLMFGILVNIMIADAAERKKKAEQQGKP